MNQMVKDKVVTSNANVLNSSNTIKNKSFSRAERNPNIKWKSILGIILVMVGMLLDMPILFGALYIIWAISDIKSGEAYILEYVSKEENPVLYWITTLIWLLLGIYVFVDSLIRNWLV